MPPLIGRDELRSYIPDALFAIDDDDLDEYYEVVSSMGDVFEAFRALPSSPPANIAAVRDAGRTPTPEEDPYNAVIRWCSVRADSEGILAGKRFGLKDNMAIAGVPLTCGSRVLQGYVPEVDCVVTERLLEAGAEIVAITNTENFTFSGAGDTSHYGPVLNPFDRTRTASGSSGGSAAALHYSECIDITFGTDQGGSIRIPASWCGVLGLMPTFGLVPYTGIIGIDQTCDFVGPMARRVEDVAVALQAVAGGYDLDPRQADSPVGDYVDAVATAPEDLSGTTVGVVKQGFGSEMGVDEGVVAATLAAIDRIRDLGAEVREVSIPEHLEAGPIAFVSFMEGYAATFHGFGSGYHWRGRYSEDLPPALGKGLAEFGNDLPPTVKSALMLGTVLRRHFFSTYYAKAQNLRRSLRQEIDTTLEDVDFLVIPTSTELPHKYVARSRLSERVLNGWSMAGNCVVFNMTGHPALSMPVAEWDGLPVGLQLASRRFSEASMLRFARVYEESFGWLPSRTPGREQVAAPV